MPSPQVTGVSSSFHLRLVPMPKTLKAEGWYGPKTTGYYIEYRVRRLRERVNRETFRAK